VKTILDILPSELRLELGNKPSVLSVRTSERKYLVFSDTSDIPAFVIQPGKKETLLKLYDVTSRLHNVLPERIPAPITVLEDRRNRHYLVQKGDDGIPWFSIRQRIGKDLKLEDIVNHSIEALSAFHTATSSQCDWTRRIHLANYFVDLENTLYNKNVIDQKYRNQFLEYCTSILNRHGNADCFYQHGDFCVNNLMYKDQGSTIIDFEQFGDVFIPLHDEFNLTTSLLTLHPSRSLETAETVWRKTIQNNKYDSLLNSDTVKVFLIMHIIWWLLEIDDIEHRSLRKNNYLRALKYAQEEIVKDNINFLENMFIILSK